MLQLLGVISRKDYRFSSDYTGNKKDVDVGGYIQLLVQNLIKPETSDQISINVQKNTCLVTLNVVRNTPTCLDLIICDKLTRSYL